MNLGASVRINKFGWFLIIAIIVFLVYIRTDSSSSTSDEMPKSELVSLKKMLIAAIHAAELGGKKVVAGKKLDLHTKSKGKTKEGANDPVTDADYASNCIMYYSLAKTFPNSVIISEEHDNKEAECIEQAVLDTNLIPVGHRNIVDLHDEYVYPEEVTFWIDPLDATQEYTENLNHFVTTMVCVAIKGVPIIGVIHSPFKDQTSWGWFTKGWSDNLPSFTNKNENKLHPRVVVSRSHKGEVEKIVKESFGDEATVEAVGGSGYKVLEVANQRADVYIHTTAIKKWDICAGDALIKTLNGQMTTLSGKTINYSANSDPKNTEGLLVALFDHQYYLNKSSPITFS